MNIIVDSTFNPLSYKDLMQPVYDYKQAYEEVEAAYSDLVTQTEAWKDIANREKSPEAYAMYKNYSDQLNAIVDDFSQGMNPRNRGQLLGMKRRYASEITPIARASEAMQAANALRDQAGPDAIFEVGRYDSIDDFLHGKTANNKYESRKDITARTAALSQAVAQSILEDPIIKNSMSPQFLEIIQKGGLGSLEELQAAIANNPAAANRFAQIRNQMIDQVGGLDRFDAQGRTAIEGAINEGLYAGLNNYQTSLQQNGEYMTKAQRVSAAQNAAQLALQREQWNYKMKKDQEDRAMAEGRAPVGTRPDGTLIYSNALGETWTKTPTKVRVTDKNKAAIANSRGVKPEAIKTGTEFYKYIKDGKTYYGTTPYGYNTGNGIATLQYNKPSAPIPPAPKTPTKLGEILGVTNLRIGGHGANQGKTVAYDKGTANTTYDKDALINAELVTVTSRPEDLYIDYFLKEHPGVKKGDLKFYHQWVDADGEICSKNEEGARQVLLITDKQ